MSLHNWSNKKIINENTSSYMDGIDYDYIEELTTNPFDKSMLAAKWKTIKHPVAQLAARLGSLDIASQMGRVSPKIYAQQIIDKNPQLDISNASDDDIRKAFAQVKISTEGYLEGIDYDLIEEARGKKITDPIRAKLMGMEDIRDLKGTMTPRYFATKVIRFLQKENPELDLENLSNDDIQNAINVVSQVSKPLAGRSDVKITTRERGAAKEGLKKGDTGFETLQLNLGGDKVFKSEGGVGDNDLYTTISDGLKYRVTLNKFKGTKLNLDDIKQDDVVSVVIVKPSETEKVDKFGGEIEMGDREKLVADFPEGEEGKFDRYGRRIEGEETAKKDHDGDGELESSTDEYMGSRDKAIKAAMNKEEGRREEAENCPMSGDEETYEYGEARADKIMNKEKERAGQAHARAVADHYDDVGDGDTFEYNHAKKKSEEEDEPAEDNILPVLGLAAAGGAAAAAGGHLMKKALPKDEEEQVAMSQQDINNYLLNQYRQKMQNAHSRERMHRHGY